MNKLSGGDMVAQALEDEGVEFIFGYPGGAVLHIYDSLFRRRAIPHILVRHEQAATHAADGYSRATGKVGVVLVTSGPGATNAVTGIATASMDSIPMVVISGQVPSHLIGTDAFQETDMIGISRPLVKHSFLVRSPEEIPRVFKEAFYIAASGRPGPVVIDIPKDHTHPGSQYPYAYPESVRLRSYTPFSRGHSRQIRKAVQLMLEARRPIIYSGGGVVQGNASELLQRLARMTGFPVTNTLMGLGAFPGSDEQCLGMLGMHGSYEANMAMHYSDFILALGARFDDRVTNTPGKFCRGAKIVHVDADPASIAKMIPVDVPIVGQADQVLEQLLERLQEQWPKEDQERSAALGGWWEKIEEWRAAQGLLRARRYEHSDEYIKPQQVVECLYRVTEGKAFVTSDVGQHQMFVAQYYPFDKPRRWINSGGLGTMGFGLPAAMGVQLAYPEETVVCVTGEGSIQMNIQELSTCTHYRLPVKIVNINNQNLGMVRQWQDMQYEGRYAHSTYENSLPDFAKLAEAYGHVGIRVEKEADLEGAMRECIGAKDRLVFLDVQVDPDEHVYPMHVAPDGAMCDMWLSKTERS